MRRRVLTLAGAWLLVFWCLPVHGQISSERTSVHPQAVKAEKDPKAIFALLIYPL
jgi:hypothetical protein